MSPLYENLAKEQMYTTVLDPWCQEKIIAKPVPFSLQRKTEAVIYLVTVRGCWAVVSAHLTLWPLVMKIEWTPQHRVCTHSSEMSAFISAGHTQCCTISCPSSWAPEEAGTFFKKKDLFSFPQFSFRTVANHLLMKLNWRCLIETPKELVLV